VGKRGWGEEKMKKTLLTLTLVVGLTATAQVKVGNNPTTLATDANFQVEATNGTQFFINKPNGNVGIGTTTPSDKLTVAGDIQATLSSANDTADVFVGDSDFWSGPTYSGAILRKHGPSYSGVHPGTSVSLPGASMFQGQNSTKVFYGLNGDGEIYFTTGGGIDMTILPTGNVGIELQRQPVN